MTNMLVEVFFREGRALPLELRHCREVEIVDGGGGATVKVESLGVEYFFPVGSLTYWTVEQDTTDPLE